MTSARPWPAGVALVILASGFGRRMRGADKLLMPVGGMPLLRRQARTGATLGADVTVTLPVPGTTRAAVLEGLAVRRVSVPDAAEGMAAAIRAGVAALPRTVHAAMILPGDMPDLDGDDLLAVARAFDPDAPCIVQGTASDGTPGHPVLFPRADFPALRALSGDGGARPVLAAAGNKVRRIALPKSHALTDLDTPEDWAAWRSRNSS